MHIQPSATCTSRCLTNSTQYRSRGDPTVFPPLKRGGNFVERFVLRLVDSSRNTAQNRESLFFPRSPRFASFATVAVTVAVKRGLDDHHSGQPSRALDWCSDLRRLARLRQRLQLRPRRST